MRLSRFVLSLRDVVPGEHVLYDVIGDRYVGVDGATLAAIERWSEAPPAGDAEADTARTLAELGFVVSGRAEDERRFEAHRAAAAEGFPETAYVILMPTLSCNLACTYCFQKDHPASGRMSAETEAAALAWIERKVVTSGARRLLVHYIGGEPLLRKDFLVRTAHALAAALRPRGVAFDWEITTNGIGLEPGLLDELSALGRGAVKVTLDGDRDNHDAARVHRDGRGTFDAVFDALAAVARACPDVTLRVGGNVRPGAESSCKALLDRLEAAGLAGRFESVRFKPVMDVGHGCGQSCGNQQASTDQLTQLGARRGIAREAPAGIDAVTPCELHWDRAFVIDPAGRIYKCFAVAGRPELALGTVQADALSADPLTAGRPWESCGDDCPFAPVCLGGCLGGRYLQLGRPGGIMCDRPALEARFRAEIARRYLEEFHPGAVPAAPDVPTVPVLAVCEVSAAA
jgi:uncharacterized protein